MAYKKNELVPAYRFDEHGHFYQVSSAQVIKQKGELKPLCPQDCVLFAPEMKDGYWYVISDDRTEWTAVKKPTSAAECVGLFVEHKDQCSYAHELRKLFEKLCEESDGRYHVVRDEDLCQTVEPVPEPTEEETAAQVAEQELQDFDTQISELKDRMTIAQLCGNTDLIAELQQEYADLMATNV